jgi:transcriptional regulator with XRE-family HTH domain
MENIEVFSSNLRRFIKAKGFKTFQEAADSFDISLSYLNQLMNGEREPAVGTLQLISQRLGISTSELLGETMPVERDESDRIKLLLNIISILPTLNDTEIRDILDLANGFAASRTNMVSSRKIVRD